MRSGPAYLCHSVREQVKRKRLIRWRWWVDSSVIGRSRSRIFYNDFNSLHVHGSGQETPESHLISYILKTSPLDFWVSLFQSAGESKWGCFPGESYWEASTKETGVPVVNMICSSYRFIFFTWHSNSVYHDHLSWSDIEESWAVTDPVRKCHPGHCFCQGRIFLTWLEEEFFQDRKSPEMKKHFRQSVLSGCCKWDDSVVYMRLCSGFSSSVSSNLCIFSWEHDVLFPSRRFGNPHGLSSVNRIWNITLPRTNENNPFN